MKINTTTSITDYLLNQLPILASHLADESWRDLDNPLEHEPNWHQWGVLEHTRRVWIAMTTEVPMFCRSWDIPFVQELKSELIQGRSKWELLLITCIVHDLGKWAGRIVTAPGSYSFKGHEAISEQLLRYHPLVRQTLFKAQLLPEPIDYIASVAGLHYELGKLRQQGYQQGHFDLAFLKSAQFQTECANLTRRYKPYQREIGLIFLADSLAKVEFRPGIQSIPEIEAKLLEQQLPPKLLQAVHQLPLNIAMGQEYMLWLKTYRQ